MATQNPAAASLVETLISLGIINEEACARAENIFTAIRHLSGTPISARNGGDRKKRTRLDIPKAEMEKLYKDKTAREIADMFGVSPSTVNLHVRKFGLTTPRKGKKK